MKNGSFKVAVSIERLRIMQALIALTAAVVLQVFLSAGRLELPQKSTSSLLSIISDETRMVFSGIMIKKVDAYFHGGATVANCTLENHLDAHDENQLHGEQGHSDSHHIAHTKKPVSFFRPVKWVNSRIHAQEHRHLANEKSVELLPWIVAACRTAPKNIDSYQIGSYILNRMIENPETAIGFLEEGIKNNPLNPELEVSLAEMYFGTVKDVEKSAIHFENALEKSLALKRELTEDDNMLRLKIYFYIGRIAKDNRDFDRLRQVLKSAQDINRENVMTKAIAAWLAEE